MVVYRHRTSSGTVRNQITLTGGNKNETGIQFCKHFYQ